ncbi:restriction endonuclease subunit S [Rhodopirellula baltica]|uniref:Type I restriction-modification system S subunit n=1 Tax=Rhodopirellula baltica WH47 TaxID=991778 RepID=F2AU19_RHOBT|nr:restriction endonuclease subunit S [Rhodopirellula baltica]EGF26810.1 type I restriction-modification system S subunit [Rhodopirellula baltica WH47]
MSLVEPADSPPWESPQWQEAVSQNPGLAPFFDNLESFVELPEGVEKLRELFLDLAVRGKLVQQDESEGEGATLLAEVADDRIEYLKSRGLKKGKSLKPPAPEEFQVPANWTLTHLNDLAYQVHYGYTASADENLRDVRMLRITDIQNNMVNWQTVPGCEIEEEKVAQYELADNDLLIARTGGTIGKTYLIQGVSVRSVFASYLIRVIPSKLVCAEYLKRFLECPFYWGQLRAKSAGTGQPNVNATSLKSLIVPVPPLAEQRRIVSKVEGLMSLCDTLESQRRSRESVRERASRSVLASLTSASAPVPAGTSRATSTTETLQSSWQRLSDHFEVLLDQPSGPAHLRQSILQLAVQGKLVRQDPNDEPASKAIQAADAKKQSLISEKKLKKQWKFSNIEDDDEPFPIPQSWAWCRILDTAERVTVGHVGSMKDEYVDEGIPFLRTLNVRALRYEPLGLKFISPEFHASLAKSALAPGDVLVVRSGNVGTTCVVPDSLPEANCSDLVIVKVPIAVDPNYLAIYMNSAAKVHVEAGTVGVALTHFNTKSVAAMPLSLPPKAEQKRIVSKVSVLLSQLDELSARLRSRQSTTDALLTALIHQILEGTE